MTEQAIDKTQAETPPLSQPQVTAGNEKPPHKMVRPPTENAVEKPSRKTKKHNKKEKTPTIEDLGKVGTVLLRNEFYRDGYRSMMNLVVIQALVIVGMIGIILFVIHTHQPENRYFATTDDGRLIPMVALNEPNLSTPALMSWVAQASTEVMTFGFNDYRRRLQVASRNFTRKGWESFTGALQRSRIIESVETLQQVVTAAPRGAPILKSEGIVMGRYQWIIEVPIVLTYQAGSKTRADSMLVTMVVVRIPRLESPNGVGIEQWIARGL